MDFSTELRRTYWGAVPHTIFTAAVWIIASGLSFYSSKGQAIMFFIVAGSFTFPGGELIRKFMSTPNLISKENKLPQFFMLLAFTVPASYPLIYFACKANINYFFPAFTVLIGAHYLPFVYGYQMTSFSLLSIALVAQGTFIGYYYPESFALSGFCTGTTLLLFAALHYVMIKKENN